MSDTRIVSRGSEIRQTTVIQFIFTSPYAVFRVNVFESSYILKLIAFDFSLDLNRELHFIFLPFRFLFSKTSKTVSRMIEILLLQLE